MLKIVCLLSFRFFSVLVTCLFEYGCDSKILKDSSIEQTWPNISSVEVRVSVETFPSNYMVAKVVPP